jgi:hypothetical protein
MYAEPFQVGHWAERTVMPKRLITLFLLTVGFALAATIPSAAPLDNQVPCRVAYASSSVVETRSAERRMWREYFSARTPKARRAWARKYHVKLITPTKMVTKRTVTKQRRGRVRAATKCRDVCQKTFSSSQKYNLGGGILEITSDCRLTGCSSVCSLLPQKELPLQV